MIFDSSLHQRRQGSLCNIWYRVKNLFTSKNRANLFLKCFLMKFWKCLHRWRQCDNFDVTFESSLHQRRQGFLCYIWYRAKHLFTRKNRAKLFLKGFLMKFWKCLHKWRQCENFDVTFESSLHQRRQGFLCYIWYWAKHLFTSKNRAVLFLVSFHFCFLFQELICYICYPPH